MAGQESTSNGAPRPGRGITLASAILGVISFVAFGFSWLGMTLADRDMAGGKLLGWPAAAVVLYLGLPLLGLGVVGALLGAAALARSFRRPMGSEGRSLALVGLLGLGPLALLSPINSAGHRLLMRDIDQANVGALGIAIRMYADRHGGQLPLDVEALITSKLILPSQLRCPNHYEDQARICYLYIPCQGASHGADTMLVHGQVGCVSDRGTHVLFVDGHMEWVSGSRLEALVEQTKQRLAARAAQSPPAPAVTVASRPAP